MGPFILIPILFIVVGVGTFVRLVWGLITGGPRALQDPGAPYLYDRVYYLVFLVAWFGWSFSLLSFADLASNIATADTLKSEAGFLIGWGICAIGMGSLFLLRGDMMVKAARYRATYGFWLWRFFNALQAQQLERQRPAFRKFVAGFFVVVGVVILAVNIINLPEGIRQAQAGLNHVISTAKTL